MRRVGVTNYMIMIDANTCKCVDVMTHVSYHGSGLHISEIIMPYIHHIDYRFHYSVNLD